jgi:hypothetical protein
MESYHAHQLILSTDKRNPSFTLYASEDGKSIRVFYGLELMEVVPHDPDAMAYKLLVGRLYNAGLRVATLEEVFKVDRKTLRSWGQAILSRDPEHLARVLLGRGINQKRTPAINNYVARRSADLLRSDCPNYRATLIREIENIFEVRLSGETLRQIMLELKNKDVLIPAEPPLPQVPLSLPALEESAAVDSLLEELSCSTGSLATTDDLVDITEQTSLEADSSKMAPTAGDSLSSKCSPPNWQPLPGEAILCDHVGMLIFAGALASISEATSPPEPLLAQWFGSVLLGAMNIEQTKYLNWEDLGDLLGQIVRFPTPQREQLTRLATPTIIDAVLRWNYRQLAIPEGEDDLYYDPHTTHYTGTQNILKGWCASIRWADKLINSDYIHTAQGHPIYFECTDSFDDLRGRFFPLIKRLRACLQWSSERIITLIVDRGIYSNDVFNEVRADPFLHFITWEKGYQRELDTPWEILSAQHRHAGTYGAHSIHRKRNNSRDLRTYHFEYIERPWAKNTAIRQIIVRATNPTGNTVQLGILTDDTQRPIDEIVRPMFNRWIQENDFKYLNKHFGINQLTSYRSTPYEQLRDQLTDRQVPGRAYVEKVKTARQLNGQQARQLLAAERAHRNQTQRQQRIDEIQKAIAERTLLIPEAKTAVTATPEESKELARLRNATKRHEKYRHQRQLKIESLHQLMLQNEEEKSGLEKEVSRIDQLIEEEMVRMDLSNKTLMDAIKISARNLFYRLFAPFKAAYDNLRDDHDHYRQLTQSDGVLRWTGSEIEVHLVPQVNHPPKLRKIIEEHLENLNASGLVLPDGSGRHLRLRLTRREQISVRIKDVP